MTNKEENTTQPAAHDAAPSLSGEARRFLDGLRDLVEPLATQQKKSLRLRWFRWGVGLALLAGVLAVNLLALPIQQYTVLENDYVAVVPIRGAIMDDTPASPQAVLPLMEKAFEDAGAKAVVIAINSPGGAPVAADAIRERLVDLRAEHPDKPVIAVGEDYMTSGAYLIALGADEIYAAETSNVGSIGVIIRMFGFQELAERYGIERRVLKAGKNKAGLDQWLPMADSDRAEYTAQLEDIHDWFIERVRSSRGDKLNEDLEDLYSGKAWLGHRAADLGLIDGVGTLLGVIKARYDTTNMRMYKPVLRSRVC